MRDALSVLLPFFIALIFLVVLGALLHFCWNDAKQRGKPPLLVTLLVFCFFPVGLVAWLLFRPEPSAPGLASSFKARRT